MDDAQIYEDDHGEEHTGGSYDYDMAKDYGGKEDKDYYEYQGDTSDHHREGGSNMW